MTIEFDHFFILTDPGAPAAELLTEIGLLEGTRNDHPGQGTANRRFFFADTMLELLYIRDVKEAVNGPAGRMHLMERASVAEASPFGLVVRRIADMADDPFHGWYYYPEYFSDDGYFLVGENSDVLQEPLCICMPMMPSAPAGQPLSPAPFTELTEVSISVPVERPSQVLEFIAQCNRLTLIPGQSHCLDIVFNDAKDGQSRDLRPDLPLVIRW